MNWKTIKERAARATLKKVFRKIARIPGMIVDASRVAIHSAPTAIPCGVRRFSGLDWLKATIAVRYQESLFSSRNFLISNSLLKTASQCEYQLFDFSRPVPATCGQSVDKVLFCSVFTGGYAEKFKSLIDSRIDYCRKHGYAFALLKDLPECFHRPHSWLRIPFIYRLMQDGYDRIFYLDADAFITNPEIKLEDFLARMNCPPPTSIFLCIDGAGRMNFGSFFIRKTRGAQQLLDLIWQNVIFINHYWWENASFMDIYRRFEGIRKITLLTKNSRSFNSYDGYADPWQKGDFILHWAGYQGAELVEKIKLFQQQFY